VPESHVHSERRGRKKLGKVLGSAAAD